MSTEVFNPSALRSEWVGVRSEAEPIGDAAQAESTSPEPSQTQAEPVQAEPAPVQTPAEGLPPDAQSPAPAVDDPDLARALEMLRIDKTDPQALAKFAKAYLDTNNRAGEMGRKLKTFESQPAPVQEPTVQEETPEPPVTTQQWTDEAIEQQVSQWVSQDPECAALVDEFQAVNADIQKIATTDRSGRLVGGSLAEGLRAVSALETFIAQKEHAAKLGVELPELDEYQLTGLKSRLAGLKLDVAQQRYQLTDLQQHRNGIRASAQAKKEQFRQHLSTQRQEQERIAEQAQQSALETKKFKTEWESSFDTLSKANQIPAEMIGDVWNNLKAYARAEPGEIPNLTEWMTAKMKAEVDRLDRYHRLRSAQHATAKREDLKQVTQGGNPAVAPPLATQSPDWEKALKAERKLVMGGRA